MAENRTLSISFCRYFPITASTPSLLLAAERYWAKKPSEIEVINDTNKELMNFYEVCKNDFVDLEKMIRISLHSRSLHNDAKVVYSNPHLFTRIKRAWAVSVLASIFASMLERVLGLSQIKRHHIPKDRQPQAKLYRRSPSGCRTPR